MTGIQRPGQRPMRSKKHVEEQNEKQLTDAKSQRTGSSLPACGSSCQPLQTTATGVGRRPSQLSPYRRFLPLGGNAVEGVSISPTPSPSGDRRRISSRTKSTPALVILPYSPSMRRVAWCKLAGAPGWRSAQRMVFWLLGLLHQALLDVLGDSAAT